ncbi:MAG: formylglycine-generating enzyme family protein [Desulfosudaceae bacterium]
MKNCRWLSLGLIMTAIFLIAACAGNNRVKVPDKLTTERLNMEFVYVAPGEFVMGSPDSETLRFDDEVLHKVEITEGFYIQKTEVTQGQWESVMYDNPSVFKDSGPDYPVENISWNDAQEFVRKLNQRAGREEFRLPTEAEWEYACRLGAEEGPLSNVFLVSDIVKVVGKGVKMATSVLFTTGECLSTDEANYNGNYPFPGCPQGEFREKTTPVGSFAPNRLGLHDMHGNVNEWCLDNYGSYCENRTFPMYKVVDPRGPSRGKYKVYRGGSWLSSARYCRAAYRGKERPDYKNYTLGLRLVKTLE